MRHQWFGFTLSLLVAAAAVAVNVVSLSTNGFQPHDPDIVPLRHDADYMVHISIGGQWLWLIVDTGSSPFAVAPWWAPSTPSIPYCANPPCNNSIYTPPPPPHLAGTLSGTRHYDKGNFTGGVVQTSVQLGPFHSNNVLVFSMWSCTQPLPCSRKLSDWGDGNDQVDGIIGLAYTSLICGSYTTQNQYDTATCGSSNYGHSCSEECNACVDYITACSDAATCDDACINTVTYLGQQVGDMNTLPAQIGMDVFGMYLCPGSTGSVFVARDPLQKHALYTGAVQYTDVTIKYFYIVELVDIRLSGLPPLVVNGTSVSTFLSDAIWHSIKDLYIYGLLPTFLDTGTSGIGVWNFHVVDALIDALSTAGFIIPFNCEPESGLGRPLGEWPDIELVFTGGAQINVPAISYLNAQIIVGSQGPTYFCNLNNYAWGIGRHPDGFVLGNGVMWPYYMIFDRVGGRVGWAPKAEACPNTQ